MGFEEDVREIATRLVRKVEERIGIESSGLWGLLSSPKKRL